MYSAIHGITNSSQIASLYRPSIRYTAAWHCARSIRNQRACNRYSESPANAHTAKARIEAIAADVEVGKIYDGTVLKLLDFGAIVSILPGRDGLLHISQIANERVNAVADYLKEGQKVRVKVLEADEKGRVRLSMKAVAAEEAAAAQPAAPVEGQPQP